HFSIGGPSMEKAEQPGVQIGICEPSNDQRTEVCRDEQPQIAMLECAQQLINGQTPGDVHYEHNSYRPNQQVLQQHLFGHSAGPQPSAERAQYLHRQRTSEENRKLQFVNADAASSSLREIGK